MEPEQWRAVSIEYQMDQKWSKSDGIRRDVILAEQVVLSTSLAMPDQELSDAQNIR